MEQDQITTLCYASGSILFTALFCVALYLRYIGAASFSLALAAASSVVWNVAIALNYYNLPLSRSDLLVIEIQRYGLWITALFATLKFVSGRRIPNRFATPFHGTWISLLLITLGLRIAGNNTIEDTKIVIWASLILSILTFMAVEQLYKNSSELRLSKLWSLIAAGMFGYDIYLFAHSLVFDQIDITLWQARGAVNAAAALLLLVGSMALSKQATRKSKLTISRPMAFYTTSMTVAGSFLALMAVGGYYVQLYGGNWGTIIQVLVLFLALLAITIVFVSRTIRSRLNVWINKNFFRHKYDYREEWLQLINLLSRSPDVQDFNTRAITAAAAIFKSSGGALWMRQANQYVPVATLKLTLPTEDLSESCDSPFCQAMEEREWVFSVHARGVHDVEMNQHLPEWVHRLPDLWLFLPLIVDRELIGFMALTKPIVDRDLPLSWEDLDLLKNVGRQVASYLDRHMAAEVIAESRQFDTFNKLTAFIMHDLKNLIAQQALVVENAAKHKENPAFVEDAINTIENSVVRMSTLLNKLRQNEPAELRALELHKILMEATRKCQDHKPSPSLRLVDTDLVVNADPDQLVMSFVHLIKNAQEATPNSGFIDVTLLREGNDAIITIEDNGEGMAEDFIRNQLFKPFVTTKSGKGMGIGVYQARELMTALGGRIAVDSHIGEGTTFSITLPANSI